MRILNIRFQNLNSLVGQWEIDLTHPSFVSDCIFAITGPTGAGKTTILDAISLALYGRTPRLGKITRNNNEIMSRQTGECFAEVTFETEEGRFICHWSQRRARKRPDGELQLPRQEISDAVSGKIMENKIREVAHRVEKVTGMDFDRFTHSMLLAQGGFATFLHAPPDERAPILEQITGTEIYSQISISVYKRMSEERGRLQTLQAELAGIQLLSREEEDILRRKLEQSLHREEEISKEIEQLNRAIRWHERISRLKEELLDLGRRQDALELKIKAFAPQEERLRLATKALELDAHFATLQAIRKEQETSRENLHKYRKILPDRIEAARQAEELVKAALKNLDQKKEEYKKALPLLHKVRELDLKVSEKGGPIRRVTRSIEEVSSSLDGLRTIQQKDRYDLDEMRRELEGLIRHLQASSVDQGLVEDLAGIQGRFDILKDLNTRLQGMLGEVEQAKTQLQEATRAYKEQLSGLEDHKLLLKRAQALVSEKQAMLSKTLEGKELAHWRREQTLLTEERDRIEKVLEALQTLSRSRQALEILSQRETMLRDGEARLKTLLDSHAKKQESLEKMRDMLETQLVLLKKIEGLEQERKLLRDGEPCPLCGATEHPFAEGNIPLPDRTSQDLDQVREDLKNTADAVLGIKVRMAETKKDLDQLASDKREETDKMEEARRTIGRICLELSSVPQLNPEDPDLGKRLAGLLEETSRRLEHAVISLDRADTLGMELERARDSRDRAKDDLAKAEQDTMAAAQRKKSLEQLLERLEKSLDQCQADQEKALYKLQREVEGFGVSVDLNNLDQVLEELTQRRDQWINRSRKRSELEQKIALLEEKTRNQAVQLRDAENRFTKMQEELNGLILERDALVRERQDMFGDKRPEDEEKRLSSEIEAAEKELNRLEKESKRVRLDLDQLRLMIDETERGIKERKAGIDSVQRAFLERLVAAGFTDEEHYRSSCLSEDERRRLAQQSKMLVDEKIELVSKVREKASLLESEQQNKIERSLDDLKEDLSLLIKTQKDIQQEIGAIRQRLKHDEEMRKQQQRRLEAIEAQKKECRRWDLLHSLIGSADGKKYRNFAQGLTLEIMISHANRQLQKMTDRYLLVRDDHQPLEINVIDNYQAGEVRSTKNLSGGESFIVSLALALGLSRIASKNVRIDSLFLDEGFGTLDEEALDTALEALSGLQQNGKMIGLISHVSALKERISTRIEVLPLAGGRSFIKGPGCRQISCMQT